MVVIGVSSQALKDALPQKQPMYGAWKDDVQAVLQTGALPLIIPSILQSKEQAEEILSRVDGLLLTGGGDVDGKFYGQPNHPLQRNVNEARDQDEFLLIQTALEQQKPILAICRGIQVLNVALGGTLIIDIPTEVPNSLQHRPSESGHENAISHVVNLQAGTKLFDIFFRTEKLQVNSFHHQAVKTLGKGLRINAIADDGIIEGVELEGHRFCIGVQWHPEVKAGNREAMIPLFQSFVEAAARVY